MKCPICFLEESILNQNPCPLNQTSDHLCLKHIPYIPPVHPNVIKEMNNLEFKAWGKLPADNILANQQNITNPHAEEPQLSTDQYKLKSILKKNFSFLYNLIYKN